MKKLLSVLLALALLLSLTGCLPSEVPQVTTEPTQTTTAQTETTAPEETEPPTEATTEATEPEETVKPTQKPDPKPQKPQQDQEEDEQPRPTQEPHETEPEETEPEETQPKETEPAKPQKSYTGKEEVAAYIAKHGKLPDNFITKSQARDLGWKSGSVERYAPGKCIGGDRFYNNEGILPAGKTYYECDIDTLGKSSRGAKRIVFTKSGDIYYTSDHYETFYRYLGPNQWEKV